ncbi:hypothetical protein F5X96DRAFT_666167 [Biscogniauxia mediterranea]|nr:hypothetical protein F5X96DRAFT_666167 [Biscogniauxia mediterranea]
MPSQVVYGYPPPLHGQSYEQTVQVQEKAEDGFSAAVSNMSITEKPLTHAPPSYPQQVPASLPSPPMSVKSHPVTHSPTTHSRHGSIYQTLPGQVSSPATTQTPPPAYPSPASTPITSPSTVSTAVSTHTPTATTTYIPPPPPPLLRQYQSHQHQQHVTYTNSPVVTTPGHTLSLYQTPVSSATTPIQAGHPIRRPVIGQPILIPGRHPQPRVVYYPQAAASPLPSYNPSAPQPLSFAPPPTNPLPATAAESSSKRRSFAAGVVTGLVSTKELAKDGRDKVGRWSRKTLDSLAGAAGYAPAPAQQPSPPGGGASTATATATATAMGVCVPSTAAGAGSAAPGTGNGVSVAQTTAVNVVVPQGHVTNGAVANGMVVNGGIPTMVGQPPRPAVINNAAGRPPMGPPQMVATPMMVPGGGPVLQPGPPTNPVMGPGPGVMPNVRPNMVPRPGPMMGPGTGPMRPGNGLAMNPVMRPYFPPGAIPMMAPGQRAGQQPPQAADDNIALGARILASGLTAYNRENNAAGGPTGGGSGEHANGEQHLGGGGHAQHGEAYGQHESAMTGEHASPGAATGSTTMHETTTAYANDRPIDQTYGLSSEATTTTITTGYGSGSATNDQAAYITGEDTGTAAAYADSTVYSSAGANQAEYMVMGVGPADQTHVFSSADQQAYASADQTYTTTTTSEEPITTYTDPSSGGFYTETSTPYAEPTTAEYAYVSDTAAYNNASGTMYADQQAYEGGYDYYYYSGGAAAAAAASGVVDDIGVGVGDYGDYYGGDGGGYDDVVVGGESMSTDVGSSCLDLI